MFSRGGNKTDRITFFLAFLNFSPLSHLWRHPNIVVDTFDMVKRMMGVIIVIIILVLLMTLVLRMTKTYTHNMALMSRYSIVVLSMFFFDHFKALNAGEG